MWNTFKYTLAALTREKQIIIWVVIFPVMLATLFFFMFSGIDKAFVLDPIPTAVVKDANFPGAPGFGELISTLSKSGKDQLLNVTPVKTAAEARTLLDKGNVEGYLAVSSSGTPQVFLGPNSGTVTSATSQTILKGIVDNYLRATSTLQTIGQKNPAALQDPALVASLFSQKDFTKPLEITAHKAVSQVRYYYALFGFLSLMAANIALIAFVNAQPNLSDLGARRAVGATSRSKTLTVTFAASWLLSMTGLLISFIYLRFILQISFGGNDLACLLAFAVASLTTTTLGMLIGVIPKVAGGAKGGILMALASLMSLFAGLYGSPSMELADRVVRALPVARYLNPVRLVSDLFYSLYYYDSYSHYFTAICGLLVMSAVFFACALFLIRRRRYASI